MYEYKDILFLAFTLLYDSVVIVSHTLVTETLQYNLHFDSHHTSLLMTWGFFSNRLGLAVYGSDVEFHQSRDSKKHLICG